MVHIDRSLLRSTGGALYEDMKHNALGELFANVSEPTAPKLRHLLEEGTRTPT